VTRYSWSVVNGGATPPAIVGADTDTATVVAPASGSFTVRLTITDDAGGQDFADVLVSANSATTAAPAAAGTTACPIPITVALQVIVTVSPPTASVQVGGGTLTFVATVANTADSRVTWLVNGVAGGNTTVGTISTTGVYAAPAGAEPGDGQRDSGVGRRSESFGLGGGHDHHTGTDIGRIGWRRRPDRFPGADRAYVGKMHATACSNKTVAWNSCPSSPDVACLHAAPLHRSGHPMDSETRAVSADDDILVAVRRLIDEGVTGAPVVDDEGRVVGMLSEYECLRLLAEGSGGDTPRGRVRDFMATTFTAVQPTMDVYYVAGMFLSEPTHRRFAVMEGQRLVGVVTRKDILRAVRAGLKGD
jgi:CBS domain-containing protein